MDRRLLKPILLICLLCLVLVNSYAATRDWIGTSSGSWNVAGNWKQNAIPTSGDDVKIGVNFDFTTQPNIPVNYAASCASITFGCNYTSFTGITLTVKSGATITVTNDLTMQADAFSAAVTPNIVTLTGAGSITATNLNIISNYIATTGAYTQKVIASITTLTLTGKIALTSSDNGTYTYNSIFSETSGIVSVAGPLTTTNTTNATSNFTVNGTLASPATLQLANATALSGLSTTGTNTLSFNNSYATIEYSGGSQTIYSDLAIPGLAAGGPVYYSIKLSGTGVKTLNAGTYLTINGDFTNALANDASNYAVLTTCIVRFIGSVSQNLYGGPGNGTTFKDLNTNQGNSKYMQSGTFYLESDGTLLMNGSSAGTILYTNGLLTLLSDANSTASVGNNNIEPTIIGNVNVQRWVTGGSGYRGYRLFSSPVNINGVTSQASAVGYIGLSYLNSGTNSVLTAGPGTGFSVYNANPLIYLYDESRTTNNTTFTAGKDIGITSITGATGSPAYSVTTLGAASTSGVQIPVGNAFLLYYVGSTANTVINSSRTPDNANTTAVGYLNQGTIPVTFWNYTNTGTTTMPYHTGTGSALAGVNQMGNPYPSTITLLKVYSDNSTSVSPTFYELNSPGQTYIAYNASTLTRSSARASRYIVSGQGFLAVASGTSSTFNFQEDQKVAYPNMTTTTTGTAQGGTLLMDIPVTKNNLADNSNAPKTYSQKVAIPVVKSDFVEETNTSASGFHLQISKDSLTYEQTGIYFARKWSDKFSQLEDAIDIGGPAPKLSVSSYSADGVKVIINQMGDFLRGKRIKLFVKGMTDGLYTLSLADIQNIDTSLFHVLLIDNRQKDSIDIVRKGGYGFTITNADTTTYGANRFVLAIRLKPLPLYKLLTFLGQKVSRGVQLNWQVANAGNYTGFNLQKLNATGSYDSLYSIQSDSAANYTFIDQHPIIGNNTYRLAQNYIMGNITYSSPVTIGYNSSSPEGTLMLYPNPAGAQINVNMASATVNTTGYTADIYSSSGKLMKHETVIGISWTDDVSSYSKGVYIMSVKDTNGNVIGLAKFSKN
jgi:hypothetical protein